MTTDFIECFVGVEAGWQARVDLGACLVWQNRLDAFTGIAAPDAVDVQSRLVQQFDDRVGTRFVIDPVIDGEQRLQLGVCLLYTSDAADECVNVYISVVAVSLKKNFLKE